MKKYKLIFIFLYFFLSGLHLFINWAMHHLHHRPLASFSTLSQIYSQQQPKSAKPNVAASVTSAACAASYHPIEKKKIKITIVTKKTSAAPVSHVPVPPVTVSPAHAPVSPRTRKIKITIKKQPQKQEQEQEQQPQEKEQCFINDIAPPSSMIYNPCGDYIAPPPKCCRFFIDNRHCFLRSTDNACIDPITKIVFGFWNCEIGAKCKLLSVDDDTVYEVCGECQETQKENEEFCKNLLEPQQNDNDDHETRAEMRKKSDANRSRLAGQPAALLRHKIAMQYGMHSFNSHGNQIRTPSTK